MDKQQVHKKIAHGEVRWMAARLKPIVKKRGTQKEKKPRQR